MKNIEIELDNDAKERLELASHILGISRDELINEMALIHMGKKKLFKADHFVELLNCLGDPMDRFIQEVYELKEKSGKIDSRKDEPDYSLTIELTEHERLALEFVSSYHNLTPEAHIKECLHRDFESSIECMSMESDGYWPEWLAGKSIAEFRRELEEKKRETEERELEEIISD